MASLRDGRRFRRLLAGTTGLTFVLVLLGVATAVGGYGLTCEARWPVCDGAVFGLFPAHWGSFVEWFHRLVAMITGFAILGTTVAAWLGGADRRVRAAATLALVLTPFQVVLGALTVTHYEVAILAGHFGAALVILGALVVATALAYRDAGVLPSPGRLAGLAAVLLVAVGVLWPGVLVPHSVPLHVGYIGVGVGAFAALLAATVRAADAGADRALLAAVGLGTAAAAIALVVGRVDVELVVGSSAAEVGAMATVLLAFVCSVAAVWLDRRGRAGGARGRPSAP